MKQLVESIVNKKFDNANSIFEEVLLDIIEQKMVEKKKMIMAELDVSKEKPATDDIIDIRPTQKPIQSGKGDKQQVDSETNISKNNLKEEEIDEARINIVKARVRGGKIQRRKKVSNVPGMTLRGGQLKRMSAAERRRRKLGQRKGKLKRRAKMARTLMKRQRSLRKRKSLGL